VFILGPGPPGWFIFSSQAQIPLPLDVFAVKAFIRLACEEDRFRCPSDASCSTVLRDHLASPYRSLFLFSCGGRRMMLLVGLGPKRGSPALLRRWAVVPLLSKLISAVLAEATLVEV